MIRTIFYVVALCIAFRADAAEIATNRLEVSPPEIIIGGLNREQQIIVTATTDDGRLLDVTHLCAVDSRDEQICSAEGPRLLGRADGKTSIRISYASLEKVVPVEVVEFDTPPPIHFQRDIIPLLSKTGCNNGGCHGKASGQNGFKLSVFGFDPRADFNALVKQNRGRRLFLAVPESSLLLRKATGATPHGGGRRIEPNSLDFNLLTGWIRQGAPWGDEQAPQVTHIEVEPRQRILGMRGEQQILVTAIYEDGARRDVTSAALYSSNAETIAKVDEQGRLATGEFPGEAAITINYMGHVGVTEVLIPIQNSVAAWEGIPVNNRIDELVVAKLKKMGIVPSALSNDATFLRRLYVDAIGTLPTSQEVRRFVEETQPSKRQLEIETVLQRSEFADYWSLKFADVLLADRKKIGERGAYVFHQWLREQIASDRPYNEWVRELIAATGYSNKYGPVNFYRALDQPEDMTKAISQAFLGIRLDCAQCHHHPFDRWGQEDFFGMAGFFNGIERKDLSDGSQLVFHKGHKQSKLPLTGELVETRALGYDSFVNLESSDPRIKLADWVTSEQNPWFARLMVNRLWKHFLGRGLVEPEDDLRATNPATNEPLLEYLAQQFVESGYDIKSIVRLILNSRTYQLSSETNDSNAGDQQNFSHYFVRRMPAEVLLDAISEVTGSAEQFPGMPPGTRSVQLWDNRLPSYFLDTFGRSPRTSPCECAKSSEPTMSQALHLMNAPEIEAKISDERGRVALLLRTKLSRDELVEELCLTALGRLPESKELEVAERLLSDQPTRHAAEDFLWALLNSYDFLFIK